MKRIFLLLFILGIFLSAIITFGISLTGEFHHVRAVAIIGSKIGFVVGIIIYFRLWNLSGTKTSNITLFYLWAGMILSFFIFPMIYFIQEQIDSVKVRRESKIWIQEHCNPVQIGFTPAGYSYETECRYLKEQGF